MCGSGSCPNQTILANRLTKVIEAVCQQKELEAGREPEYITVSFVRTHYDFWQEGTYRTGI